MSIEFEDLNDGLRRIKLSGRLDIAGTESISIKFTNLASAVARRVVVDLTAVSFLASIGIRELITNAKAQQQRGGRVVLFVGDNVLSRGQDTGGHRHRCADPHVCQCR